MLFSLSFSRKAWAYFIKPQKSNHMKDTLWTLLLAMLLLPAYGQELERSVMGGGAMDATAGNLEICATIGEVSTNSWVVGGMDLCNGFHQGDKLTVGVSTHAVHVDLSVYPNPTTAILYVTTPISNDWHLEIIDIDGRVRAKATQQGPLEGFEMDLENLAAGAYYLRITDPSATYYSLYKIQKL